MNKTILTKILGFSVIALTLIFSIAGAAQAMRASDLFGHVGGASGPLDPTLEPTQDPSLVPTVEASPVAMKGHSHLSGTVTAIDATSITVGGTTVTISDKTHAGVGIAVGDRVQLEAVVQPDGSLVAIEVHKIGPGTPPNGTPEPKPTKTADADDDHQPGMTKTPEVDDDQDQPHMTKTPGSDGEHKPGMTRTPEPKETEQEHVKPSVSPEPKESEKSHVKPSESPAPTSVANQPDPKGEHHEDGGNQPKGKSAPRHGHK